jgi:predicted nucleotidyltransferase
MGRDDVLALLAAHRDEIERFGVESLRLFGSVARGEAAADSDVDLLVSFRASPTFSAYMKLRIFLEDLLGVQVDLITESGLREGVRPFVEKDAIRVA